MTLEGWSLLLFSNLNFTCGKRQKTVSKAVAPVNGTVPSVYVAPNQQLEEKGTLPYKYLRKRHSTFIFSMKKNERIGSRIQNPKSILFHALNLFQYYKYKTLIYLATKKKKKKKNYKTLIYNFCTRYSEGIFGGFVLAYANFFDYFIA